MMIAWTDRVVDRREGDGVVGQAAADLVRAHRRSRATIPRHLLVEASHDRESRVRSLPIRHDPTLKAEGVLELVEGDVVFAAPEGVDLVVPAPRHKSVDRKR